jgi:hypothetical protein
LLYRNALQPILEPASVISERLAPIIAEFRKRCLEIPRTDHDESLEIPSPLQKRGSEEDIKPLPRDANNKKRRRGASDADDDEEFMRGKPAGTSSVMSSKPLTKP